MHWSIRHSVVLVNWIITSRISMRSWKNVFAWQIQGEMLEKSERSRRMDDLCELTAERSQLSQNQIEK